MQDATTGALIGTAAAVLGWAAKSIAAAIRKDTKGEQREDAQDKRLDIHDHLHEQHQAKFATLHIDFVPRTELSEKLDYIRESQQRTEQLTLSLVTGKPILPPENMR